MIMVKYLVSNCIDWEITLLTINRRPRAQNFG